MKDLLCWLGLHRWFIDTRHDWRGVKVCSECIHCGKRTAGMR